MCQFPPGWIRSEQITFRDPFFISSNFTPCCGEKNDGTISFKIEGNQILNFSYNDTIPDCTGVFSGTGTIDSNGNLEINITGSDCDGNHIATLTLIRTG